MTREEYNEFFHSLHDMYFEVSYPTGLSEITTMDLNIVKSRIDQELASRKEKEATPLTEDGLPANIFPINHYSDVFGNSPLASSGPDVSDYEKL